MIEWVIFWEIVWARSSLSSSSHRQPKGVAWHRWRNTCANDCFTQVTSFIVDSTRFFLCTWAACVTTSHSYLHVKEIFFSKIEVFLSANMHDLKKYQKRLQYDFQTFLLNDVLIENRVLNTELSMLGKFHSFFTLIDQSDTELQYNKSSNLLYNSRRTNNINASVLKFDKTRK